jgi:hypothetical protein
VRAQHDDHLRAILRRIWTEHFQVHRPRKVWRQIGGEGLRSVCRHFSWKEAPAGTMQVLTWDDRKHPSQPRALIQQGRCDEGQFNQFSISISNGERGMTVRFDSEAELRNFLERGASEKR